MYGIQLSAILSLFHMVSFHRSHTYGTTKSGGPLKSLYGGDKSQGEVAFHGERDDPSRNQGI